MSTEDTESTENKSIPKLRTLALWVSVRGLSNAFSSVLFRDFRGPSLLDLG
jgi:hypothetical protein